VHLVQLPCNFLQTQLFKILFLVFFGHPAQLGSTRISVSLRFRYRLQVELLGVFVLDRGLFD
jgi:hypothetical protein